MVNVNILTSIIIYIVVLLFLGLLIGIGFGVKKYIGKICAIIYGIITVLFIVIFSICFCKSRKKEIYKPDNPDLHAKLYNMMHDFDTFCNKNQIKYWAVGGTSLGMVRNKGIIPHDDDIDVGMLQEDFDKLESHSSKLRADGYELVEYKDVDLQHNPLGLHLYKLNKLNNKDYWIDIFIYKHQDHKYIYADDVAANSWPDEWYKENELFPLQRYKFGTFKIYGPKKPKKFLNRAYPGWKKIRLDFPHINQSPKKILMLIYNRLGMFP